MAQSDFNRDFSFNFFQAISDLGLVVYGALDYGLEQHEQRALSGEMENMLELMSSAGALKRNSSRVIRLQEFVHSSLCCRPI